MWLPYDDLQCVASLKNFTRLLQMHCEFFFIAYTIDWPSVDFIFSSHSQCQCARVFKLCLKYIHLPVFAILGSSFCAFYVTQIRPLSFSVHTGERVRLSQIQTWIIHSGILSAYNCVKWMRDSICQVKKKIKQKILSLHLEYNCTF